MDRYQFEDLISDYIEGELSQAKRREFDLYLIDHPELQAQVDSMKSMLSSLKGLPSKKTSPAFVNNLMARVELEKSRSAFGLPSSKAISRSILGFTPAYAGLMGAVLVAIVALSFQLIPDGSGNTVMPIGITGQIAEKNPPAEALEPAVDMVKNEDTAADSSGAPKTLPDRDFQDQLILVKDQK